jgi:signal peptidase I
MSDGVYIVVVVVACLICFGAVATSSFWLVARVLRSGKPTSRRVITSAAILTALSVVSTASKAILSEWLQLAVFAVLLVCIAWLFRKQGHFTWRKALGAAVAFTVVQVGIAALVAWFVLRPTIMDAVIISTRNMTPTIEAGDRVLVDRTATPRRWDVVTFRWPLRPSEVHLSRLVGLPGETIELRDRQVFIDGRALERPANIASLDYEKNDVFSIGTAGHAVKLREDECFLLGDNPADSSDSRFPIGGNGSGAVPIKDLLGLVRYRFRPLERAGSVH